MPILIGLRVTAPTPSEITKTYYPLANTDTGQAHDHTTGSLVNDYFSPLTTPNFTANFMRFPNVDVPKGAIITEATVSWVVRWYNDNPPGSFNSPEDWLEYTVEQVDSASVPANRITLRNRFFDNSNRSDRLFKTSMNGGDFTRVPETDITPFIQSVVTRDGWVSGNAISVIAGNNINTVHGLGGIPFQIGSGVSEYPRLTIKYMEPTAQPVTITSTVSQNADAGTRVSWGSNYWGAPDGEPFYWLNRDDRVMWHNIRFSSVNVPQGATITNAVIRLAARDNWTNQNHWMVKYNDFGIEQVDNATQITNSANFGSRMGNIGSTKRWYYPHTTVNGGYIYSPNLAEEVQAIVNRAGWESGNSMMFFGTTDTNTFDGWSADPTVHSYGSTGDSDLYPQLEITYVVGGGGGGGKVTAPFAQHYLRDTTDNPTTNGTDAWDLSTSMGGSGSTAWLYPDSADSLEWMETHRFVAPLTAAPDTEDFEVSIYFTDISEFTEVRLKLQRRSPAGVVLEEGPYSSIIDNVGAVVRTLTFNPDDWSDGDLFTLIVEHRRTSGTGNTALGIRVQDEDSYVSPA